MVEETETQPKLVGFFYHLRGRGGFIPRCWKVPCKLFSLFNIK
jgi:hypothetical protein